MRKLKLNYLVPMIQKDSLFEMAVERWKQNQKDKMTLRQKKMGYSKRIERMMLLKRKMEYLMELIA